jgi:hypothetical protein
LSAGLISSADAELSELEASVRIFKLSYEKALARHSEAQREPQLFNQVNPPQESEIPF